MNGAQWLVRMLRDRGVEHVFALCGNGLNPFLDACLDFRMKVVDVRNEQAAAYMADLSGRMTRRLGVVAVSSGPGHTNAVTGVANSWWDGGPMLLLSGCSEQNTRGMDNFQEIDQVGIVAPITKYASMVHHVSTLENETDRAIAAATAGRPGPVHLTIPNDVFSARMPEDAVRKRGRHLAEARPQAAGDSELVRDAVKMLANAKRPVIVVGSGAFYADAWPTLRRFVTLTNIPVFTPIWDRGCIDRAIPQYVGLTSPEVNGAAPLLCKADVLLVVGARVDYRLGYGQPPVISPTAKFIRVDIEPSEVERTVRPEIGLVGDPRTVLGQMTEEAKRRRWKTGAWLARLQRAREKLLRVWEKRGREDVCPVHSLRICREVRPFLRGGTTFLLDGGNIGRWAHMLIFDRHPSHWMTCGASGVVGWGIPGALAAKLARPEKPVLLLSGDGSAGFTLADIQTALRFGTPYVAVIANDAAWGIVTDGQPDRRRVASEFGELRFDRVAEALGARGVHIEHPAQLGPAIRDGLRRDTVTIINVPTQLGGIRKWDDFYRKQGG